jgi:hypothetical protein
METWHWRDWDLDSITLDALAVELGPAQNMVRFMVVDPIECDVEVGGDGYCIDGEWPSLMLHGDEEKDKCYLAAVTPWDDMPKDLQAIMEAFSPVLKECRYRNFWSMETRDGRFIDATCRGGKPSINSQCATWWNFPEIVFYGAHGQLIDPIPAHNFCAEALLTIKHTPGEWRKTRVESELQPHCTFDECCRIDGAICFPPDQFRFDPVGWLVSGGDSMKSCNDKLLEMSGKLPDGLSAATDEMIGLLAKIQAGEKEGVEFSDQTVPDPETAINV